jgi:hypothetical protein
MQVPPAARRIAPPVSSVRRRRAPRSLGAMLYEERMVAEKSSPARAAQLDRSEGCLGLPSRAGCLGLSTSPLRAELESGRSLAQIADATRGGRPRD